MMNTMNPSALGTIDPALQLMRMVGERRSALRPVDCAGDVALLLGAVQERLVAAAGACPMSVGHASPGINPSVLIDTAEALGRLHAMLVALTTGYQTLETELLVARTALVQARAETQRSRRDAPIDDSNRRDDAVYNA